MFKTLSITKLVMYFFADYANYWYWYICDKVLFI